MKHSYLTYLELLIKRYPILDTIEGSIAQSFEIIRLCYESGGKLLIAGNGGSCADAEHIVGELMKGFKLPRHLDSKIYNALIEVDKELGVMLANHLQSGLPAISLSSHTALNTAFLNDVNGDLIYAQQLNVLGRPGDVFLGISTSGNAKNIQYAAVTAKAKGMKVLALTGRNGGMLDAFADVNMIMPIGETYQIQELHLPVYHCLCLMLEEYFFGNLF